MFYTATQIQRNTRDSFNDGGHFKCRESHCYAS